MRNKATHSGVSIVARGLKLVIPFLAYSFQGHCAKSCVVHGCQLRFDASQARVMEKQNAAGSNPGVRVPPKIKIKALEAVKVRDTVAAHKKLARVALSRRSLSFAFTCM
jgi:hypothetical protein